MKNYHITRHLKTYRRPIAISFKYYDGSLAKMTFGKRQMNHVFCSVRLLASLNFPHICEQLFKAKFQAIILN